MQASELQTEVTAEGIRINGVLFATALPPSVYVDVLGPPTRIVEPGPPAPWGHRNHKWHVYDDYGVVLNEHHASRQIGEVGFILDPEQSSRRRPNYPRHAYEGSLDIGGVRILRGMLEREYPRGGPLALRRFLPGWWTGTLGRVSITLKSVAFSAARGRRSRLRTFVDVHVSFVRQEKQVTV